MQLRVKIFRGGVEVAGYHADLSLPGQVWHGRRKRSGKVGALRWLQDAALRTSGDSVLFQIDGGAWRDLKDPVERADALAQARAQPDPR